MADQMRPMELFFSHVYNDAVIDTNCPQMYLQYLQRVWRLVSDTLHGRLSRGIDAYSPACI